MAWDDAVKAEPIAYVTEETLRAEMTLLREVFKRMEVKLDLLGNELQLMRRGNSPKQEIVTETLDELRQAICRFMHEYFNEHAIPLNTGKISRVFSHRLHKQRCSVADALREVVPRLFHACVTEKGATVYIPRAVWDSADESQRNNWSVMSESDHYKFKENHRKMIQEFQRNEAEIERKAAEYKKRLQSIAATGAHGLPESEEAFSDLTTTDSSDK